ncbi:hypothetical protein NDU88_012438, partial [Pleurodeles waltl]
TEGGVRLFLPAPSAVGGLGQLPGAGPALTTQARPASARCLRHSGAAPPEAEHRGHGGQGPPAAQAPSDER